MSEESRVRREVMYLRVLLSLRARSLREDRFILLRRLFRVMVVQLRVLLQRTLLLVFLLVDSEVQFPCVVFVIDVILASVEELRGFSVR